jgi:hypothetical protein
MTDTPPDWVLIEAAKRSWWFEILQLSYLQRCYGDIKFYRALCDMILKHEQPPMDRKLLCAREANRVWERSDEDFSVEDACVRAIELWEEGFGK